MSTMSVTLCGPGVFPVVERAVAHSQGLGNHNVFLFLNLITEPEVMRGISWRCDPCGITESVEDVDVEQ